MVWIVNSEIVDSLLATGFTIECVFCLLTTETDCENKKKK